MILMEYLRDIFFRHVFPQILNKKSDQTPSRKVFMPPGEVFLKEIGQRLRVITQIMILRKKYF